MIEEMKLTMLDFLQHSTNTLSVMKAKYKKELLRRAKHSPKGPEKLTSAFKGSSVLSNSIEDDDISVISLEDEHVNSSSKC